MACKIGCSSRLIWLGHGFDARDESFHVQLLAFNEAVDDEVRIRNDCKICLSENERNTMVFLGPCTHQLCEGCFTRLAQELMQGRGSLCCPFCNTPVERAQRVDHTQLDGTFYPLSGFNSNGLGGTNTCFRICKDKRSPKRINQQTTAYPPTSRRAGPSS